MWHALGSEFGRVCDEQAITGRRERRWLWEAIENLYATERIKRDRPEVKVLARRLHEDHGDLHQWMQAVASAYLLKRAVAADLIHAIRAVARGETYLSPAVSRHVIDAYVQRVGGESAGPLQRLTPRQREVLQLIAEGHSTKEMARKLGISVKTIEMHRAQLMAELDIHDVAGLVRYAIRTGLVSADG